MTTAYVPITTIATANEGKRRVLEAFRHNPDIVVGVDWPHEPHIIELEGDEDAIEELKQWLQKKYSVGYSEFDVMHSFVQQAFVKDIGWPKLHILLIEQFLLLFGGLQELVNDMEGMYDRADFSSTPREQHRTIVLRLNEIAQHLEGNSAPVTETSTTTGPARFEVRIAIHTSPEELDQLITRLSTQPQQPSPYQPKLVGVLYSRGRLPKGLKSLVLVFEFSQALSLTHIVREKLQNEVKKADITGPIGVTQFKGDVVQFTLAQRQLTEALARHRRLQPSS